ncbi:MAG TPA: DUF2505 family protein [Polyangiales bacterium]|nr:DUF2505 family protein [Polyangiales bacterium]
MNFEIEHVFDAPVEAVEAAMFHPQYATYLLAHSDVLNQHAVRSFEDDGLHITRKVFIAPKPTFDKIGNKNVPPEWFELVEESTYDRSQRTLSVNNVPLTDKIAKRLINRGEVRLESLANGKTRRIAKCEIKVHDLPLLARPFTGMIEQLLAKEARRMIEAEAGVMRDYLASQSAPVIQA